MEMTDERIQYSWDSTLKSSDLIQAKISEGKIEMEFTSDSSKLDLTIEIDRFFIDAILDCPEVYHLQINIGRSQYKSIPVIIKALNKVKNLDSIVEVSEVFSNSICESGYYIVEYNDLKLGFGVNVQYHKSSIMYSNYLNYMYPELSGLELRNEDGGPISLEQLMELRESIKSIIGIDEK